MISLTVTGTIIIFTAFIIAPLALCFICPRISPRSALAPRKKS